MTVNSTSPSSPQTVTLSGTGLAGVLNLSPASMGFGNTLVGQTSGPLTETLTNPNGSPDAITINSVTTAPPFSIQSDGCSTLPSGLGAGASCTITVDFSPTAQGAVTGGLAIMSNAKTPSSTITLKGTGTLSVPTFNPPSSINFGTVTHNEFSTVLLTVANGNATGLTITGITVTNVNNDYTVSGTSSGATCGALPITLPSNSSCTVAVTLTPTVTTTDNGSLTFTDNASPPTQKIGLFGRGN
jgi:Abnormal spindle-like microcephaly-assoc'd, ASPM-SPD-2-Hydin